MRDEEGTKVSFRQAVVDHNLPTTGCSYLGRPVAALVAMLRRPGPDGKLREGHQILPEPSRETDPEPSTKAGSPTRNQ